MTLVTLEAVGHACVLVMPTPQEMAGRLDPGSRLFVCYHFGWRDERGRSANTNSDKTVCPALLGVDACGVDPALSSSGVAGIFRAGM
jgi:hypothetical protein